MEIVKTSKNKLIIPLEEYEILSNGELLNYVSYKDKQENIYKNFIKYFVSNDTAFEYLKNALDKGYKALSIATTFNEQMWQSVNIDTMDAIGLFDSISDFNKEELEKINVIKNTCSMQKYFKDIENEIYTCFVDNEELKINIENMMKIFLLEEKEFIKEINKDKVLGIDKCKFIYVMNSYFTNKNIFNKYKFKKELRNRYLKIKEYQYLDYESINYFEENRMFKYNVEINPKLKEEIFKEIDETYTPLEKSIYIYIKLCKLFTYDDLYYANGQYGEIALLHQDLKRVKRVSSSDDLIVCYEFNAILGRLLEELSINYTSNSNNVNKRYGKGHANLIYCYDKYIVMADSVTSIIAGDLVNAKLNDNLKGLVCLNKCSDTRNEFEEIVLKVYSDIILNELKNNTYNEYNIEEQSYLNFDESIIKRLFRVINLVDHSQLKTVDSLGYMVKLKNEMFSKEELKDKISFSVVRSNLKRNKELIVVITIKDNDKSKYFYYIPKKQFRPFPKTILKILIDRQMIEYIEGSRANIPGFENRKIKK